MPETPPVVPAVPAPAAVPAPPAEPPKPAEPKKSLEDLLASLDDNARSAVLGEVTKARSEAANYRGKLREAEPKVTEYDRLVEASKTAGQRATEAATAADARASKLLNRAVTAEVKALASPGFADPDDAAAFLDLSKYATTDGDVDTETVKTDLAALLARKPHLGKAPSSRLPGPNPAQGSSGSGAAGLTPEQEAQALEKSGDYRAAGVIKANQLLELRKSTT